MNQNKDIFKMRVSVSNVSVLIPVYNSQNTIQRAVDSVLKSDNLPKEIIIYDDASSDETLKSLRKLYGSNPKIKILSTDINVGAGVARRRLLAQATGDLIAFLDADDEWLENKLQKQIDVMNYEKSDLCVCGYELYDKNSKCIGKRIPPRTINYLNMHLANWIPTSMVVFRASLINSKAMPDLRQRQDYAFWLNLLRSNPKIKISVISDTLGKYYRQSGSLSSNKLNNVKLNYKVFRKQMGYGKILSAFLVFINVMTRFLRA